jgi:hypothetical protein
MEVLEARHPKVRSGRQTIVRILDAWPDAPAIVRAHRHLALII